MGGSAIGGDLAAAALGDRLTKAAADGARLRAALVGAAPAPRSSARATRATPRRPSPVTRPPRRSAPTRIVATTGGQLADSARADGVPVIGLPSGLQPRAAVGYMFCVARRGRRARRGRPGHPHRDRRRRRPPREPRRGDPGPGRRDRRADRRRRARLLRRRADQPGRLPLEDPGQRERASSRPSRSLLPEASHNEIAGWEGSRGAARVRPALGRRPAPARAPALRGDRRADRAARRRA